MRAALGVPRLRPGRGRLRLLVRARRAVLPMLPLGALAGLATALALLGLGRMEAWISREAPGGAWGLLLPGVGLTLTGLWLHHLGVGPVSLAADLEQGHHDPYGAFPFRGSLAKAWACVLTVAPGGAAGVEGPAKWLGAALGVQVHRLLRPLAHRVSALRRVVPSVGDLAQGGAAASLAAVFRAPLTGALLAAERGGHLGSGALAGSLCAAAAGYLAFRAVGHAGPLLPLVRPVPPGWGDVARAVPLGILCGLGVWAYRGLRALLRRVLGPLPLPWRGAAAGLGLALLALPSFLAWDNLLVTQGGGLPLVTRLLQGSPGPWTALAILALRTAATALTFEGGGVGGTWLPSVAMGASVGALLEALLPTGHPGLLPMLGATAFSGAAHGTLLVPVAFLAETTGQAGLVAPGLVAASVAFLVAREEPGRGLAR